MRKWRVTLALAGLVICAQSVSAQSMFVRKPSQYLGYGYGNYNWVTFTGMWDSKFGAANITSGSSITSLAGYTALFLDANQPGTAAYNLSAAEVSTITSFLSGGGRLYAFGENNNWQSWNSNILSMFGATFGGFGADGGTPLVANNLTAGVGSINTPAPGFISDFNGGTSLFSNNIAGLFNSNSIVVLDINICDDGNIVQASNSQFCQNIVDFTAGGPLTGPPVTATPEPASIALVATGLLALGAVSARRRKARSA